MHKKLRLAAFPQIAKVRIVDRRADGNQAFDVPILATDAQSDPAPEAEAREQDRRVSIFRDKESQRRANVIQLPPSAVVPAFAQARAAKVEPQDRHSQPIQRFRGLIDHFVVERSAKEGMRMADQGRSSRRGVAMRRPQHRFQFSRRPRQKEILRLMPVAHRAISLHEPLHAAGLRLAHELFRRTVTVTESLFASISIPVTSPSHSSSPDHGASLRSVKETSSRSPNAYSRWVTNLTFPGATSTVTASSCHGTFGGRTLMGSAMFLSAPFFLARPRFPPLRPGMIPGRSNCRATAQPCRLLSPAASRRSTRASTSGCMTLASTSKGKVTHSGCPGECASWHATSNPPREALMVSQCSIRWPSGADHLSLAESRNRTRGYWRRCISSRSFHIAHRSMPGSARSAGSRAEYMPQSICGASFVLG